MVMETHRWQLCIHCFISSVYCVVYLLRRHSKTLVVFLILNCFKSKLTNSRFVKVRILSNRPWCSCLMAHPMFQAVEVSLLFLIVFLSSVPIQNAPLQQLFPPSKIHVYKCFCRRVYMCWLCAGASGGQRGLQVLWSIVNHHMIAEN